MTGRRCVALLCPLILFICTVVPSLGQTENPILNEAIQLHCKGQVAEAITKYQEVAQSSAVDTEVRHARFAIGACLFSLRQYANAIATFTQFANDFPDDFQAPLAIIHSGNCFAEQGRYDEAAPYYERALQIQQPDVNMRIWLCWAHLGMGKVLVSRGNYADALYHLELAVDEASEVKVSDEAKELLNECFTALGQAPPTGDITQSIAKASLTVAKAYYSERKYNQALDFLRWATSGAASCDFAAEGNVLTASCQYVLLSNDKALTAARAVAKIGQESSALGLGKSLTKGADWIAQAARLEARVLMRQGNHVQAVQVCDDAIALHADADAGTLRELRLTKSNALLLAGKVDDAVDVMKELRSQDPTDLGNLAVDDQIGDYYMNAKRFLEAIQAYTRVISESTDPQLFSPGTSAGAYYKLAYCYHATGDLANARRVLKKVIDDYATTPWKALAQSTLGVWNTVQTKTKGN